MNDGFWPNADNQHVDQRMAANVRAAALRFRGNISWNSLEIPALSDILLQAAKQFSGEHCNKIVCI